MKELKNLLIGIGVIMSSKTIFVSGGAGFIGSALIKLIIETTSHKVINIDKLTYAGNLESLKFAQSSSRYFFEKIDICDSNRIRNIFDKYQPDAVMHLAAESHVDRSIDSPNEFIQTNVIGTYKLLEESRYYFSKLHTDKKNKFIFHHVSTDEVYGDLGKSTNFFTEKTPYAPSSPYSASKASSDHLVRAWHKTFGLPTLITNCSNNYGPRQYPEKLIPLIIRNALAGKDLPVYGDGKQIRDWLYVDDHASALLKVAFRGVAGNTYNIGGHNEVKNIEVVQAICNILDKQVPYKKSGINSYSELITFVEDRAGHDVRYAIDASKIANNLDWKPSETFSSGLKKTVDWYIKNSKWCEIVLKGSYKGQRLGVIE